MSKPTSYNVSPSSFERAFGFTPCSCHEYPSSAHATYTVEYETEPYSSMIKRVTVTCRGCGRSKTKNVRVNGDSLPF